MLCFPMIRVSGESKSRLVKAAGAESCGHGGSGVICKSKCAKHLRFGTLLELTMWKGCPTQEIDGWMDGWIDR